MPIAELLLQIEALEVIPTYGALTASDHNHVLWVCVIFIEAGKMDDQLFCDDSMKTVVVFQNDIPLRTVLEVRMPTPGRVFGSVREADLSHVPDTLWTNSPDDVVLFVLLHHSELH